MRKSALSILGLAAMLLASSVSALEYELEFDGKARVDFVFETGQVIHDGELFTFAFKASDEMAQDTQGDYFPIVRGTAYFKTWHGTVIPVRFNRWEMEDRPDSHPYFPKVRIGNDLYGADEIYASGLKIKELPESMTVVLSMFDSAFNGNEPADVVGTHSEEYLSGRQLWMLGQNQSAASFRETRISRTDWNFVAIDAGDRIHVHVTDIAPDGSAVTGETWGGDIGAVQAFVWTMEEGMVVIGGVSGTAVSCDGEFVSGIIDKEDGSGREAGIWHRETGWQPLGGSLGRARPNDMSCDGQVIVGEALLDGSYNRAVFWTVGGQMVQLAEFLSSVESVSADGSLAWGWEHSNAPQLVEWSLPGGASDHRWTSYVGSTVMSSNGDWKAHALEYGGRQRFAINHPMRLVADVNDVPGSNSSSYPVVEGIDDRGYFFVGQVVTELSWDNWIPVPVVYDYNELVLLRDYLEAKGADLSVVGELRQAMGISADGQTITGTSKPTTGSHTVSWVATTDPRTPPSGYTIWTPPPPPTCELDWNCDGVVDYSDLYDTATGGFYQDWQLYNAYHTHPVYGPYVEGGYYHKQHCGEPGNLDWDGNGVVEYRDVYGGNPSSANVDTFYTQYWVLEKYPSSYSYYYPNSFCD